MPGRMAVYTAEYGQYVLACTSDEDTGDSPTEDDLKESCLEKKSFVDMNKHNLAKAYELDYFKRKKVLTKRKQKKIFHLYEESLLKRFPKLYKHNKYIYDDIQDLDKKWKKGLDKFKYPARKRKRNARLEELWKDCYSTSCSSSSDDEVSMNTVIQTPQDVPNSAGHLLPSQHSEDDLIESQPAGQLIHSSDTGRFGRCSPTTSSIFTSNIEQQPVEIKDEMFFDLGSEEVVESELEFEIQPIVENQEDIFSQNQQGSQKSTEGYAHFTAGSQMYTSTQQNC